MVTMMTIWLFVWRRRQVIETRKFGLTPGLSPKELIQEAEVLRTITHPNIVRLQVRV
jgi:hypothetical protein